MQIDRLKQELETFKQTHDEILRKHKLELKEANK